VSVYQANSTRDMLEDQRIPGLPAGCLVRPYWTRFDAPTLQSQARVICLSYKVQYRPVPTVLPPFLATNSMGSFPPETLVGYHLSARGTICRTRVTGRRWTSGAVLTLPNRL